MSKTYYFIILAAFGTVKKIDALELFRYAYITDLV
jgi:hypothetical protein